MICYHHTDMDGKSAGWLVHTMHPQTIEDSAESYIPTNYGDKFDKHTEKDDVFIVDISISDTSYQDFLNTCKTARSVTWIDHHQTSLDIIEKHKEELQRIDNLTYFVSKCACGAALTYSFFKIPKEDLMRARHISEDEFYNIHAIYKDNGTIVVTLHKARKGYPGDSRFWTTEVKLPQWLFHVDDYDCWKKIDPLTNILTLGVESEDTSLTIKDSFRNTDNIIFNPFWTEFTTDAGAIVKYISSGKSINKYIESRYARELSSTFEWEYKGTKFICKNAPGNSWNFGELIKQYPAAILFHYNGKSGEWKYSVYSDDFSDFDCSEFCKLFGGGGHVHAAGFQTKDLIFLTTSKEKNNVIFLGGTVDDDWRTKFIHIWNKSKDEKTKEIELFNPIIDDWNEEARKKENDTKENAKLNLFVITPNQKGMFSFAEMIECAHSGKVFFALVDTYNQFDKRSMSSYNSIGELVEKHKGIYKVYSGESCLESLVDDVIASI